MPPIRKGDGTPVVPNGIGQVRSGDGRVFYDGPAIPDSVVDDFEDANIGEYSGDAGNFATTTTDAPEGDHALSVSSPSAGAEIYSQPGDGLNYYPGEGDTLVFLVKDVGGQRPFMQFMRDNSGDNRYGIRIQPGQTGAEQGEVWLRSLSSGSATTLGSMDPGLSFDVWYWVEIGLPTPSDDEITVAVHEVDTSQDPPEKGTELGSMSANDNEHVGNEGIAFVHGSSTDGGATWDWMVTI